MLHYITIDAFCLEGLSSPVCDDGQLEAGGGTGCMVMLGAFQAIGAGEAHAPMGVSLHARPRRNQNKARADVHFRPGQAILTSIMNCDIFHSACL